MFDIEIHNRDQKYLYYLEDYRFNLPDGYMNKSFNDFSEQFTDDPFINIYAETIQSNLRHGRPESGPIQPPPTPRGTSSHNVCLSFSMFSKLLIQYTRLIVLQMARYSFDPVTGRIHQQYYPELRKVLPVPCLARRDGLPRRRLTYDDLRSLGLSIIDCEHMFEKMTNRALAVLCHGLTQILYRPSLGLRSFLLYTGYPPHSG